ncbi:MAG: amylo-alpha-1,6-glucosidase [Bacteroidota bacterium]
MGYLKFDKTQLVNLEYALDRELLRVSRSGSYASTTIIGCNTRKYHGLLVAPQPDVDSELHVLLSTLDETIIQHDRAFNLGIHKYPGGIYRPAGHKYITDFESDPIPSLTYRVGGVVLKKERLFSSRVDRVMIRYTLLKASSHTRVQFRPFMAFRQRHSLSRANTYVNKKFSLAKYGISMQLYENYTEVFMQFSKQPEYVHVPDWYYNIEYFREQERGYDYQEDLFVPGFFEISLKKGESVVFSAGLEPVNPLSLKQLFGAEIRKRIPRDSYEHCLENAAEQFIVRRKNTAAVVAGYPWFGRWGRDTFIALPGLTLTRGDLKSFNKVVKSMITDMKGPLFTNIGEKGGAYNSVDAPLWFIWALQQLSLHTRNRKEIWRQYGKYIQVILEGYRAGTSFNIGMTEQGLIRAGQDGYALTWMDAVVDGKPVTQRKGMPVEINALWYNALMFSLEVAGEVRDTAFITRWKEITEHIPENFLKTFWSDEHAYLADVVDGDHKDWSVRPNMVFAASLPYSPVSERKRRDILEVVRDHLLTPKGLRTLSPRNRDYKGDYYGDQRERDMAYHQGTVWPWLLGAFVEGYLKIHGKQGLPLVEEIYHGLEEEMAFHGVGTLSEVHDGNPPHKAKGAISQAWSVAEILRIRDMILKFRKEGQL